MVCFLKIKLMNVLDITIKINNNTEIKILKILIETKKNIKQKKIYEKLRWKSIIHDRSRFRWKSY